MNSLRLPLASPSWVNGDMPAKTNTGTRALGRVVDRAAERLRAAFDMHDDRLGAAGQLRVAMGAAHRHHFVGTGDDGRNWPTERSRLGDRLDQRRMIAAEIGEDVGDARFLQRLEHCRAGGIHSVSSRSLLGGARVSARDSGP